MVLRPRWQETFRRLPATVFCAILRLGNAQDSASGVLGVFTRMLVLEAIEQGQMIEELQEQCRHAVPQILARRGWELVQDKASFIEEVVAEAQRRQALSSGLCKPSPLGRHSQRTLDKVIEDATVNRYGHLWHAACGADGTLRQRRAFTELHHYLYPIALHCAKHDQHLAEESTQEALVNAWQHLDQVRDPGSFARWASTIVSRQVKAKLRKRVRKVGVTEGGEITWQPRTITEADLVRGGDDDEEAQIQRIGDRSDESAGQEPRMTDALRARIETAIRHCLRSRQQQAVIIGLFLEERGFVELADALAKKVSNIYVLKTRALARLRECEEFLEVLEELL